jgi:phosphatidate cytidylyltransferase
MKTHIYYILITLFVLGGILISIINRKKSFEEKKENWIKFVSYIIIVNLIIISILYFPEYFYIPAVIISLFGLFEIVRAIYSSRKILAGILTILIFLLLIFTFVQFAQLDQNILLFTYLVVIIFDAFSQMSGQLFGKIKLVPNISPNKTLEGLAGGMVSTIVISAFFYQLIDVSFFRSLILSMAITIFAFLGDLLASYGKRRFNLKDFSKILPEQGGVLDRFDSLIFASLIVTILKKYNFFNY